MSDLIVLDDLKTWLSIDLGDTTRDVLLASLVSAASEACIGIMHRDPTLQCSVVTADGTGGAALPLNNFPIQAVQSVIIDWRSGGQPLPANQYDFDSNLLYLLCGKFPRGRGNIQVTYTAGLSTIPNDMALAVKYTAKAMWDARKTDMNSTGESFSGVGGSTFWPTGPGSVPPQAVSLLGRYQNTIVV